MNELPSSFLSSELPDHPVSFPLKTIELQFLKSIQSNFEFHKANADKIAIKAILTFEGILDLKIFNSRERCDFIKTECNKVADYLAFESSNKWLATLLNKVTRDKDVADRITQLEARSAQDFHQALKVEMENAGETALPFKIDSTMLRDAFVGLNKIWGYKMYYDHLKEMLLDEESNGEYDPPSYNATTSNDIEKEKAKKGTIKLVPHVIPVLRDILLPYFTANTEDGDDSDTEESLLKALSGKSVKMKLLFRGDATQFVYVFRELCDHKLVLLDNRTDITHWIDNNFKFTKGLKKIPTDFNERTVYRILTGGGLNMQIPRNKIDLSAIIKKT